jgi:KaiC/GvpD/RAD55 family RecA-like ATPase/uncharacterized protein (DUF3084 family)
MPKKKKSTPLPPAPDGTVDGSWGGASSRGGSAPAPSGSSSGSSGGSSSAPSPSSGGGKKGAATPKPRATVPTVVDMTKAREEALFQLRLGRQSLAFGFIVGLLLIVDSAIALLVGTGALAQGGNLGAFLSSVISNYLPLALPLAAAVFLSAAVFYEKWDTYGFWPPEDHFALTLAGLALSLALAIIYGLHFVHPKFDPLTALSSYVYPLCLVALSLGMLSLGATWRGTALRKLASLGFAVLPPILYFPLRTSLDLIAGAAGLNLALSISFSFAAFLYISSGAQLHLMASATRAQEREVVAGSQEKLFQLSQELSRRSEAAAFREEALARREADDEAQEAALVERTRFLEDRRSELERLDSHLRKRSDEVAANEQGLLPKLADVRAAEASHKERSAQLATREDEINTSFARLGERERQLLQRDQAVRQKEVEIQTRAAEVARAEAQARAIEGTAQQRLQEAERRFAAATAKEGEVRSLASTMSLPGDARGPLVAKEADLSRREAELESKKGELADRTTAVSQREQALERKRVDLQQVAAKVLEREKALASREAAIGAKEGQYEQGLELLKAATRRHEEETVKYYDLSKKSALAESQVAIKLRDLSEKENTLSAREQKIAEADKALQSRREEAERLKQEFLARQRALEAQASDLTVRSSRLEEATARLAPSKSEKEEQITQALRDRERALEFRERQLADREHRLRAMAYERDRQAAGTPAEEPAEASGTSSSAIHRPGRALTGTPRLDDLLFGGFPPKGHVGFVGPAFVGKEVAAYAFLAEGLRHGEAAVILATGRAPSEFARDLGTLVPSLVDYEQSGRVIWIDASNPSGLAGTDARAIRGSTVKGPGDLVGILQAVSRHTQELEKLHTPFRLAFLSLSACMTQTDDKGAAAFVQNLLGILRPKACLGVYSIDRGMHSLQQVEGIVSQMDGAIEFRSERGKTQLQVIGLGEVQSRQWVDYRFTQRALQLGSFSLERIR